MLGLCLPVSQSVCLWVNIGAVFETQFSINLPIEGEICITDVGDRRSANVTGCRLRMCLPV